jgi:predicted transcriptional regulator
MVGIISEADLMRREEIGTEDTPLAEIAALLERNQIKRVPITKDGKLVGVVSRSNIIQALASSKGSRIASGMRIGQSDWRFSPDWASRAGRTSAAARR